MDANHSYYLALVNEVNRAVGQLLGRASGPLHIRLWIQPAMAIAFAIHTGLRDAREHKPAFLWEVISNPTQRRALLYTAWKDIGMLIIIAFLVDLIYQLIMLNSFYLLQALIVTFVLAVLPYIIFRGIATRLASRFLGGNE